MEYTRPATWEDVKTLVRYLTEAGAEYVLVGGYAIAAHGFNRFSEDIDILVDPSVENSRRWILALARLPDAAAADLAAEAMYLPTTNGMQFVSTMSSRSM